MFVLPDRVSASCPPATETPSPAVQPGAPPGMVWCARVPGQVRYGVILCAQSF